MTSKLLKTTVLATVAIAIGALASPVTAATHKFTFASPSGAAYCDGLTLTRATSGHPTWGGTHTGCTNGDPAGGYIVRVNGGPNYDIATTDSLNAPTVGALTFYLNLPSNQWFLYETIGGLNYQVNNGILINGAPPAKAERGVRPSTAPNPKGKLDQMF